MNSRDELFLRECCFLAWSKQTLALPNPSVGAIVCDESGRIIGRGVHSKAGLPHAEVLALQEAYYRLSGDEQILSLAQSQDIHDYLLAHHNSLFMYCTLYVSLEPCNHQGKTPSCASLLIALKPARVCVGIKDPHILASGGFERISQAGIHIEFIESDSIKTLTSHLLLPFEVLRKTGRFVLFKIAQRLDGSFKDGRISSDLSRRFTHNQRSVCDWIVISGQTFRTDTPKLNARYATPPYDNQALPKIAILSQSLQASCVEMSLKQREIRILHELNQLSELSGFVVIEGGWNLLSFVRPFVDMLLVHQAFCLQDGVQSAFSCKVSSHFKLLHSMALGEDMALWMV